VKGFPTIKVRYFNLNGKIVCWILACSPSPEVERACPMITTANAKQASLPNSWLEKFPIEYLVCVEKRPSPIGWKRYVKHRNLASMTSFIDLIIWRNPLPHVCYSSPPNLAHLFCGKSFKINSTKRLHSALLKMKQELLPNHSRATASVGMDQKFWFGQVHPMNQLYMMVRVLFH